MSDQKSTAVIDYIEAKQSIKAILDSKVREAIEDIRSEFGVEVVDVELRFEKHQTLADKHARGIYLGCRVELPGETDYL